jgi:hypothetical protein
MNKHFKSLMVSSKEEEVEAEALTEDEEEEGVGLDSTNPSYSVTIVMS